MLASTPPPAEPSSSRSLTRAESTESAGSLAPPAPTLSRMPSTDEAGLRKDVALKVFREQFTSSLDANGKPPGANGMPQAWNDDTVDMRDQYGRVYKVSRKTGEIKERPHDLPPFQQEHEEALRVPLWRLIMYASGGLGLIFGFVLLGWAAFFYVDILKVSPIYLGALVVVYGVVNALNDLYYGRWSDRLRSRWGRRRPSMVVSIVPTVILFFLAFVPKRSWSEGELVAYISVVLLAFNFAYSAFTTAFSNVFVEFVQLETQRATCNAWRFVFMYLAVGLGSSLPPAIAGVDFDDTLTMSTVVSVLGGICCVLCAIAIIDPSSEDLEPEKQRPILESIRIVFADKSMRVLIKAEASVNVGIFVALAALPFWAKYVLGVVEGTSAQFAGTTWEAEEQMTLLLGTLLLVTITSMGFWMRVVKRIGPLRTWRTSLCLAAGVSLFIWFGTYNLTTGFVAMLLYGLVLPGSLISTNLLFGNIIDLRELENGTRDEGLYNGVNQLTVKMITVPMSLILPVVLETTGYIPDDPDQPAAAVWGIRTIAGFIPFLGAVMAFYFLGHYPLQGPKLEEFRQQLAHSRRQSVMSKASRASSPHMQRMPPTTT